MNPHTDWKLILRYLCHSLTPEEEQRFNAWLTSDFENQKVLSLLESVWHSQEREQRESDTREAWENLAQKAGISIRHDEPPDKIVPFRRPYTDKVAGSRRSPIYRTLRYAAIVLLVISLPFVYKAMTPALQMDPPIEMREIFVEYGTTASLILQDGTKITLDAGSTFSYPKKFGEEVREVSLTGEGFFEVAPDPQKPFIVTANEALVRVVGTKFNVKAWSKKPSVQVAVAEGSVSLRSASHPETGAVLINRGQLSALLDHQVPTQPVAVNINKHIAWLKRELVLENTALSEVLDQLERWYHLEFKLPDPFYKSVKISGVIKKKPINDIIEAIALMINLESRREGNQVVFLEKSPQ